VTKLKNKKRKTVIGRFFLTQVDKFLNASRTNCTPLYVRMSTIDLVHCVGSSEQKWNVPLESFLRKKPDDAADLQI